MKVGDKVFDKGNGWIGIVKDFSIEKDWVILTDNIGEEWTTVPNNLEPYQDDCPKSVPSDVLSVVPSQDNDVRNHNVGKSDYAQHKIQPWDIWIEYHLNPFDADIVKRVLRKKEGESRRLDYEKIIHICQERIRQIDNNIDI